MPIATVNWLWIGNLPLLDATPATPILLSERRVLVGYEAVGNSQIEAIAVTGDFVSQGTNANSFASIWDASAKGISPTTFSYDLAATSTIGARMVSAFAVNMQVQTGSQPDVFQTQSATLVQLTNGDMFFRPNANAVSAWDAIDRVYSIKVASIDESAGTAYGSISQRTTFKPAIFDVAFPCYAAGTLITTSDGQKPVEVLEAGDLVLTSDDGWQPVRWIGRAVVSLDKTPHLYPIRIPRGALGSGTPSADLMVSPQHRVLVRSKIAARMFGAEEVLVAAKQLLGHEGIEQDMTETTITYVHFMCDDHQVVFANDAACETLYLGDMAIANLGAAARQEIFDVFPDLRDSVISHPARHLPCGSRSRKMVERHGRHLRPLVG
ncbi:Hint domain-containing protein [Paracoccus sp. Ld10]|uniref:Hint domain-containing protein n=1 Tax=Paracoccus sp. Ld10 TaxID=649158 RepID=UPI003870EC98